MKCVKNSIKFKITYWDALLEQVFSIIAKFLAFKKYLTQQKEENELTLICLTVEVD